MTILITGATGFIGERLVQELYRHGNALRVLVRPARLAALERLWPGAKVSPVVGDLLDVSSLRNVCHKVRSVFHLAGHAHAAAEQSQKEDLHWRITVEGTRALLAEAVRNGVERFVFVSSVKAMGEGGAGCLDETSACRPATPYARAKLEAERLVLAAGREHGMHVCVLRLPLVYGPGTKGNLSRMIEAIDRGRFPPLPEVGNRRSMVHVDDVIQALRLASEKDEADGQIYIVTDGRVYTSREIYTSICRALGKPIPRWAVPAVALRTAAYCGDMLERVFRRPMPLTSATLDKLLGSAWYTCEKIVRELGYRPTQALAEALPQMVQEYRRVLAVRSERASSGRHADP